jgi:hypothetical protein
MWYMKEGKKRRRRFDEARGWLMTVGLAVSI